MSPPCNHRRDAEFHAVVGGNPVLPHRHDAPLDPFLHRFSRMLEEEGSNKLAMLVLAFGGNLD